MSGGGTELHNPLDVLAAAEGVALGTASSAAGRDINDIANASMITTGPLADGTTTTEARSGTVSIIVSYRPNLNKGKGGCCVAGGNSEAPPSYDSLFAAGASVEMPPHYSAVTADIAREQQEEREDEEVDGGAAAVDAIRVTEEVEVTVESEERSLCAHEDCNSDDGDGESGRIHELTASVNVMVHN